MEKHRRRLVVAAVLPFVMSNPIAVYAQYAPPPQEAPPPQGYPPPPPQEAPPPPPPDAPAATPQDGPATPQQLDQMLAPIALYPDQLLAQIFIAASYPLQVVEAERWLQDPNNAGLSGNALVATLQPLPWDPSVKALVPFPQVIKMMGDQLEWTQSLGNVFVNQQADVLNRVQFLRQQARAAGQLQTTPQMVVQQQGPAIVIEPANPQVLYVPVYDPMVVYGAWPWPAYRPYYFPGFFAGGRIGVGVGVGIGVGIGFSVGFGIVGPLWGWTHPNWGGHNIYVNNVVYNHITVNRYGGFAGNTWHHVGPFTGGGRFAQHAAFHPVGNPGGHGIPNGGHGPGRGPVHPQGNFGHGSPAGGPSHQGHPQVQHAAAQPHGGHPQPQHTARGGGEGEHHEH